MIIDQPADRFHYLFILVMSIAIPSRSFRHIFLAFCIGALHLPLLALAQNTGNNPGNPNAAGYFSGSVPCPEEEYHDECVDDGGQFEALDLESGMAGPSGYYDLLGPDGSSLQFETPTSGPTPFGVSTDGAPIGHMSPGIDFSSIDFTSTSGPTPFGFSFGGGISGIGAGDFSGILDFNSAASSLNYDPFAPGQPGNTYYQNPGTTPTYGTNYDPFAPGEPGNTFYQGPSYDTNYDPFAPGEPANSYTPPAFTTGNLAPNTQWNDVMFSPPTPLSNQPVYDDATKSNIYKPVYQTFQKDKTMDQVFDENVPRLSPPEARALGIAPEMPYSEQRALGITCAGECSPETRTQIENAYDPETNTIDWSQVSDDAKKEFAAISGTLDTRATLQGTSIEAESMRDRQYTSVSVNGTAQKNYNLNPGAYDAAAKSYAEGTISNDMKTAAPLDDDWSDHFYNPNAVDNPRTSRIERAPYWSGDLRTSEYIASTANTQNYHVYGNSGVMYREGKAVNISAPQSTVSNPTITTVNTRTVSPTGSFSAGSFTPSSRDSFVSGLSGIPSLGNPRTAGSLNIAGNTPSFSFGGVGRTGFEGSPEANPGSFGPRGVPYAVSGADQTGARVNPVNGGMLYGNSPEVGPRTRIDRNGKPYASHHDGTDAYPADLKADREVVSVTDGTVVTVKENSNGYGKYVEVKDNETGVVSRYAHIEPEAGLKVGDTVNTGERIGKISGAGTDFGERLSAIQAQSGVDADTAYDMAVDEFNQNGWGSVTRPHLHYEEFSPNGKLLDSTESLGWERGKTYSIGTPTGTNFGNTSSGNNPIIGAGGSGGQIKQPSATPNLSGGITSGSGGTGGTGRITTPFPSLPSISNGSVQNTGNWLSSSLQFIGGFGNAFKGLFGGGSTNQGGTRNNGIGGNVGLPAPSYSTTDLPLINTTGLAIRTDELGNLSLVNESGDTVVLVRGAGLRDGAGRPLYIALDPLTDKPIGTVDLSGLPTDPQSREINTTVFATEPQVKNDQNQGLISSTAGFIKNTFGMFFGAPNEESERTPNIGIYEPRHASSTPYIPVYVYVDESTGTAQFEQGVLQGALEELPSVEDPDPATEVATSTEDELSLVLDDVGNIVYSNGEYAPPTVDGVVQEDVPYEYVYVVHPVRDGVIQPAEVLTDEFPGHLLTGAEQAVSTNADEGTNTNITPIGGQPVTDLRNETSNRGVLAWVRDGITSVAKRITSFFGSDDETEQNQFTDLSNVSERVSTEQPPKVFSNDDIVSGLIQVNLPSSCPDEFADAEEGYMYSVMVQLSDPNELGVISGFLCGVGDPEMYARAVAEDLVTNGYFITVDEERLLSVLRFGVQ